MKDHNDYVYFVGLLDLSTTILSTIIILAELLWHFSSAVLIETHILTKECMYNIPPKYVFEIYQR